MIEFMLVAAWISGEPFDTHLRNLGQPAVSFVNRFTSASECENARLEKLNSRDPYNPKLIFKCIELRN